jgi:LPS sulfotransferase NodH
VIQKKFIILCGGRSGSTYLQQILNSHPTIKCYDEIFNVTNKSHESFYSFCQTHFPTISWFFLRGKISSRYWNLPLAYMFQRYLTTIYKEDQSERIGFKLIYNQLLYYYPVKFWIRKNPVPIIHLQRRNILKAAISLLKAKKYGVYISTSVDLPQNKKIKINAEDILNELKRLSDEKLRSEFIVRNNPSITIYYEDLFEKQSSTMQQIIDFLQLELLPFQKPDITKTNPEKISEILENYAEVERALIGTAWEKFLD